MHPFGESPYSAHADRHPIVNVAIPLTLWLMMLPLAGYVVCHFVAGFEFYHPLNFGPFWGP